MHPNRVIENAGAPSIVSACDSKIRHLLHFVSRRCTKIGSFAYLFKLKKRRECDQLMWLIFRLGIDKELPETLQFYENTEQRLTWKGNIRKSQ